ncbi:Na+:solute symporter [bacterium]|nr:Na+:solute symporter [bacterium]
MTLNWLDYSIIIGFVILTIFIGLYARKTASKGLEGFFLGGKNLPWYLAGISMVATTFAADTPLAVTELVATNGISGNWVWWNMLLGGMFTAVFYAKLWRKSGVLTETEFITLRYSGKEATWLKKFKAAYLGLFMNALILAWVNLAFMSLLEVFFGIQGSDLFLITAGAMLVVALYTAISGLLGVALTDAFQFFIALVGCIVLAVLVLNSEQIGGIDGLVKRLPQGSLDLIPSIGSNSGGLFSMSVASFLAFAGMVWWSSWYPGAEPGGGGYVAQRMLSTKDEKHSFLATLFFQFAHYGLRPWPWIIVGLCSVVLYPELGPDDKKLGFVMAMKDFLPNGMMGLLLVAFLGAYMSTVSTHLNWGASYVVNDIYKWQNKGDKTIVRVSRLITLLILILALIATTFVSTISGVWEFIMQCGAGLGLLLMLRWFWFRINAWAEITATVAPFIIYAVLQFGLAPYYPELGMSISENPLGFFITVGLTTIFWIIVALSTAPSEANHLLKFKERVFPEGMEAYKKKVLPLLLAWLGGIVSVYSFLFLVGKIIFKEYDSAINLGVSLVIGLGLFYFSSKKADLF